MDFDKIKYFLVLADTLSYTKASQKLFISQSMLSRYIMSLEEELHLQLFRRNSHGVTLTSVGNYMKNGLRSINGEFDAIIRQARIIESGLSGELRLGMITVLSISCIQPILSKYERLNPGIRIALRTFRSPGELKQSLINEQIDFGFGMSFSNAFSEISSIQACNTYVNLVTSKLHPLANAPEGTLHLKDFQNETFITPVDDISTAHNRLKERCGLAGFVPEVITVPDIMTVLLWIELNRGVTFMHDHSLANGSRNLVFHRLKDFSQPEPINLYWNPKSTDTKVLAFLNFFRSELEET